MDSVDLASSKPHLLFVGNFNAAAKVTLTRAKREDDPFYRGFLIDREGENGISTLFPLWRGVYVAPCRRLLLRHLRGCAANVPRLDRPIDGNSKVLVRRSRNAQHKV